MSVRPHLQRRPWAVVVLLGVLASMMLGISCLWQGVQQAKGCAPDRARSEASGGAPGEKTVWPTHPRGTILDRCGAVLALSEKRMAAFACPHRLPDVNDQAARIASVLGLDAQSVAQRLAQFRNFVWLSRDLSPAQGAALQKLKISGVSLTEAFSRVYPHGILASSVLGFVGPEGRGLEGIEYTYDASLQENSVEAGLRLTLERGLQAQAERELDVQTARLLADRGCLVIMDMKQGEILAMASRPTWDPERFWESDVKVANRAIEGDVDPVSLLAMLSMLSGEIAVSGRVAATEQVQVGAKGADSGQRRPEAEAPVLLSLQEEIEATRNRGWEELVEGLVLWSPLSKERLASLRLEPDLPALLLALGLGQLAEIDLPGESPGCLATGFNEGAAIHTVRGLRVSPIQLLVAFTALVGDGRVLRPHLRLDTAEVQHGVDFERAAISPTLARQVRKCFSVQSGPSLATLKWSGGERPGNANPAQVSVLGFWPPRSPVVSYVLVLDGVQRDPRRHRGTLGRVLRVAQHAALLPLKETGAFEVQITSEPNGEQHDMPVLEPQKQEASRHLEAMPRLHGQPMRKALALLQPLGFPVRLQGRGVVVEQVPAPGTPVAEIKECRLRFAER